MRELEDILRGFLCDFLKEHLPRLDPGWWEEHVVDRLSDQQRSNIRNRPPVLESLDSRAITRVLEKNWLGDKGLSALLDPPFETFNFIKGAIQTLNRWHHQSSEPVSVADNFADAQNICRLLKDLGADQYTLSKVEAIRNRIMEPPQPTAPVPEEQPNKGTVYEQVSEGIDLPPCGKSSLITKADVHTGMNLKKLIESAISNKKLITWGAMHEIMFGGPFVYRTKMKNIAHQIMPGADALLVDKGARFSSSAPVKQHKQWLIKNGYKCLPGIK